MAQQYKGSVLLLLTAMIWGAALVAQSVSMDLIGPFTFQCARSILGALVLLPVIAVFSRDKGGEAKPPVERKTQWTAGLLCGVIFFAACGLQQCGLVYTTAGKAGFITALYIVLVPIAGIFFHRKVGWNVWTGVVIGVVGLYLLCVTESFSVGEGDLLVCLGAFAFGAHILVIDHFSPKVDGVKLSCMQFAVNAALSGVCMLLFERPSMSTVLDCWLPIVYAGVLSGGLAYTLQIIGQRYTSPTVASLILSLESVFAVLFGWLLLHEALSGRELAGCALMFAAIVLAQLPFHSRGELE
jgi:Permeases of the drug/metabolite transporter (DMT) superfamily